MTESELNPEMVKRTQDSLGKFVKKPPLTEKLLRKPPFKFIHDVVKVVIRDTNFLDELYTDDELNADNIKDRDGKMKFLQKLIDVLKIVTQKDLQARSSKIVAGLEADKTNELFQAIAYALDNKLDSREAVNAVKHGQLNGNEPKPKTKVKEKEKAVKPTKPPQAATRDRTPAKPTPKKAISSQGSIEKKAVPKEKVKEKERSTSKSRGVEAKDTKKLRKSTSKDKEISHKVNGDVVTNGSLESQSSIQSLPQQVSLEKVEESSAVVSTESNQKSVKIEEDAKEPEAVKVNGNSHNEIESEKETHVEVLTNPQDELAAIIDEEAEYRRKQEKTSKKLSAKHRQKSVEDTPQPTDTSDANQRVEKVDRFQSSYKRESVERPRTSLRPPSARPASSRPAAPRRRDKNIEIVLQPEETMKLGEINVKMENFSKELEDDGENLVIIEDSGVLTDSFMDERLSLNKSEPTNLDEQGKLVQQILETEKNFESALGMENAKKTEIEFDESKSHTNVKQIENLKDLIQKLVRSVNPMGKLMDFVQEDIDSMQREFTKWNEIYKQATMDLKKEQIETANAIEPLKYQLIQLDNMIKDHHQSIERLRGNLVSNEQKIFKLFTEM